MRERESRKNWPRSESERVSEREKKQERSVGIVMTEKASEMCPRTTWKCWISVHHNERGMKGKGKIKTLSGIAVMLRRQEENDSLSWKRQSGQCGHPHCNFLSSALLQCWCHCISCRKSFSPEAISGRTRCWLLNCHRSPPPKNTWGQQEEGDRKMREIGKGVHVSAI